MGRRSISVEDDARWVFNRLAEDYLARPGYPETLARRLLDLAGGVGSVVADLGAGTGNLALPLASNGARVFAVEPARAMLRALESRSRPAVVPIHAPAEQTNLLAGSCQLALLADALQWVDADRTGREVARILMSQGTLAVVEARPADTPFMRGLAALIAAANFKARPPPSGKRAQLFAVAGVTKATCEHFTHEEWLSPERLGAVLRSISLVGPALGPARLSELLEDACRLADAHGGIRWERDIVLTWGRVPSLTQSMPTSPDR